MKKWAVWLLNIWFCAALCWPAQALNRVEVPDYHVLLQDRSELPEDLKLVQDLLSGKIQPDSDWSKLHRRETEVLFVELLSDAVMAESLGLTGLLANPESVLAAFAQQSGSPRLQKLEQHYQLWRQGQYQWHETESDELEGMLQRQLLSLLLRDQKEIEALPWIDEPSGIISRSISVEYFMLDPDAPKPPVMLDVWAKRFGHDLRLAGPLTNILENLQLSKQLPYPTLEVQSLMQLAEYFDKQEDPEQAQVVLQAAKAKASASGLKALELQTVMALIQHQPEPQEELLKLNASVSGQSQKVQYELEKTLIWRMLKARQFKQAEPDLRHLITSEDRRNAAWALGVAVHVGYPFARQMLLDAIQSDQLKQNELAVNALSLLPSPHLPHEQWPQARITFMHQLSIALLELMPRADFDLQTHLTSVFPNEVAPELFSSERLRPLLVSKNHKLVQFALEKLLQSENLATSKNLLAELTRLLTSEDIYIRYFAVRALPELPFEELFSLLKPVLDDPDILAWPQAWVRLAKANAAAASAHLTSFCKQADQKELVFGCLKAQYEIGIPPQADELVRVLHKWSFEPGELGLLMASGSDVKTWAALAQAAVNSESEARLQFLTALDDATAELPQTSESVSSEELQANAALDPIASLLHQGDASSRVLVLNLWSKRTAGLETSVMKQALLSPEPAERAMAISLFALQLDTSNLPAPPLSSAQVLAWLQEPDRIILLPSDQSSPLASRIGGSAEPLSWHGYLASILRDTLNKPLYMPALTAQELYSLLKHPHMAVRQTALELLANSGNPDHIEFITALLQDPEIRVRSAAYDALVQLNKRLYLFYLDSLKNNSRPASELEEYLTFIVSDRTYQHELYQDEYAQILENPIHRQTLWKLAASTHDEDEKRWMIDLLRTRYFDKGLLPFLSVKEAESVRFTALKQLLAFKEDKSIQGLLKDYAFDSNAYLQLEVLNALFDGSLRTRQVLKQMADKREQMINPSGFTFLYDVYSGEDPDGPQSEGGPIRLEQLVADSLVYWLSEKPLSNPEWSEWMSWIQDRNLPLSWRKIILERSVFDLAEKALPLLQKLSQDPDLGTDVVLLIEELELLND